MWAIQLCLVTASQYYIPFSNRCPTLESVTLAKHMAFCCVVSRHPFVGTVPRAVAYRLNDTSSYMLGESRRNVYNVSAFPKCNRSCKVSLTDTGLHYFRILIGLYIFSSDT
jgi:hypothetical protein